MYRILVSLVLGSLLSACGLISGYKQTIEQGNVYTAADVERLQLGMSKAQCAYILGNSILAPVYVNQEWHYVYTLKPKGQDTSYKKYIILIFNPDDQLTQIITSDKPKT